MAFRQVTILGLGEVAIYKRRGVKNIRLSITSTGTVRVTIPYWAPYASGEAFVRQKTAWVKEKMPAKTEILNGSHIGKAHRLVLEPGHSEKVTTRVADTTITVRYPTKMSAEDSDVQRAIQKAAVRALKQQANSLLPKRLEYLAEKFSFTYKSISIKQLKGRWGSCSHQKDIVLNCFLMQLEWEEIDYVLLHELTHTVHMSHNSAFWIALKDVFPKASEMKKRIRTLQPILNTRD